MGRLIWYTRRTAQPFDHLYVALGNGNGTFGTPTVYNPAPSNYTLTTLECGDFNGDGWPDVALVEAGPENRVHIYLNAAGNLVEKASYPVGVRSV